MTSITTTTATDEGEENVPTESNRVLSRIERRGRDGTGAFLAGGALLVRALAANRRRPGRGSALALASVALFGLGVRQRSTDRIETLSDAQPDDRAGREGEKRVSDEAYTGARGDLGANRNADESRGVYQSETRPNPRGTTDRADVRDDEGGRLHFVVGKEPETHRETHLEHASAYDPRLHPERDDQRTEIDLSTAAMADETSEAAGPHPEQSYPAREGTDPEPTSEAAPERTGQGAVAPASGDTEADRPGAATGDGDEDRSNPDD